MGRKNASRTGSGVERGMIRELWAYRELAYFLAWRDVKVRYKQTVLGMLWAGMQPFLLMLIFVVLFGRLAKIPTDQIPQPIFYFSALVPWIYFSTTVSSAGMSLVSNMGLLTKVYFPRVMLPVSVALSNLVDFLIGSMLFIGFMVYYQLPIGSNVLLWPVLVILLVLLSVSLGLFLAALNVKYRDFRYIIPFAIQMLLFGTPIIYPASMVPEGLHWLVAINPLSGIIEAFRYSLVPNRAFHWELLLFSTVFTLVLFITGIAYFNRAEKAFADII
jgi:lipopolysaccharide transport system permease protein